MLGHPGLSGPAPARRGQESEDEFVLFVVRAVPGHWARSAEPAGATLRTAASQQPQGPPRRKRPVPARWGLGTVFKDHVLISRVSVSRKDEKVTENVMTLFKMVFNIMKSFSDPALLAWCAFSKFPS